MGRTIKVLVTGVAAATLMPGFAGNAEPVETENVQPISPPVPTYPVSAAEKGIEGRCETRFSVDENGHTYDILAFCSDPAFCHEVKRAISRVEFAPLTRDGEARERHNVTYPFEFRLQTFYNGVEVPSTYEDQPLEPCEKIAVS